MTIKILLDTDIGSDIDDAVCLAYLLAQPGCDLLGITTVTGQARERAMLASAICRVVGREVPIYPGAEHPLLVEQRQKVAAQAAALGRWDYATDFPAAGEAIQFMRRTIRAHPGEVTLLTIGPLTNVALLFATDPEIPALLKALVTMGGYFFKPAPEWNIMLDPHASAIVYRAGVPEHRSIGLDVTTQVQMPADAVRERFAPHKLLRPVLDFAEVWFRERPQITFHDPLAAATIFDDQICAFERGRVEIEWEDKEALGLTRWEAGQPGAGHEVAVAVQPGRFFAHFFSVFQG
ncbi:MAG: nucleoside hydrolase [Anaerolineae bacterium]|nr:nucleoside hydrolase [Anaerolineae bacterium]